MNTIFFTSKAGKDMDDPQTIKPIHKIVLLIVAIGLVIADLRGHLPIPLD
jgi:hypothetical protein